MSIRILSAVFLFAALASVARADLVQVRTKDTPVKGTVKSESSTAVVVTSKDAKSKKDIDESIPAMDVIDIYYDEVKPAEIRLGAYAKARAADKEAHEATDPAKRKAAAATAIEKYTETLKGMSGPKLAVRNVEYRLALLMLLQAHQEQLGTEKALARLQDFRTRHPASWQVVHVLPVIAQLQLDAGNAAAAEQTLHEMADMDSLPLEVRRDAELMIVTMLLRAGKSDLAQKKLDTLAKKSGTSAAFASRLKLASAELLVAQKKLDQAVPILQQVVRENGDKTTKAMAHNTLGECLFKNNRYSEALWEFLWVDAVFNQDKAQHAKALYYLWKTFEQLQDADRGQECRQLLLDRQFAGTEFQRKANAEK